MRLVSIVCDQNELEQAIETAETLAIRYPTDQDIIALLIMLQNIQGDIIKGGDAWSVPELHEK